MIRRKAYFARSLEAALAAARRELGPDALLVEAGPAGQEDGAGTYRVVCEGPAETAPGQSAGDGVQAGACAAAPADGLQARMARLEKTLEMVASAVAGLDPEPGIAALQAELAAQDFPASWIGTLLRAARNRLQAAGRTDGEDAERVLREAVAGELAARITFQPDLLTAKPAVLVLAGPPGAGKTSMLVKIAMQAGLAKRRPAAIVSTDCHRVAAAEQLRTLAAILGLPFNLAETPAALRQAVAEHSSRDMVLVDTPGFGRKEKEWAGEWAGLLRAVPGRQTLLVLPACWRTRDLLAAVSWWGMFEPSALAFTRLDETETMGGWAATAMESGLPVAYFSTGQGIPEDLEPAGAERLRSALGLPEAGRAAAGKAAGGKP